jgi:DNA-3-methyladenine glycosylase II
MADFFTTFAPLQYHTQSGLDPLRISFLRDGDCEPVAVSLRWQDGAVAGVTTSTGQIEVVANQTARIFGLDHDGTDFPLVAQRDPALAPIFQELVGLRQVSFTSTYECAAWAIISQRIQSQQAARIQASMAAVYGTPLVLDGVAVPAFPAPRELLSVTAVPGLNATKVERLHGVARAALDGKLDVQRLRDLGDEAGPAALREIKGIGDFWSSGIYLRSCGIVDVFPHEPHAVVALAVLHGLTALPDATTVQRLTDVYRPYRMWVCFMLRVALGLKLIPGADQQEALWRAAFRSEAARRGPRAVRK